MRQHVVASTERTAHRNRGSWSRWSASPGTSFRRSAARQAEYARRIATILNAGVLQDAVVRGLEEQGQFEIDVLDVLDALDGARLKLVDDDRGEASHASTALIGHSAAHRVNSPVGLAAELMHGGQQPSAGRSGSVSLVEQSHSNSALESYAQIEPAVLNMQTPP